MVVPCEGILYAQVVQSDIASRWNQLHPVQIKNDKSSIDLSLNAASNSSASLALHDLQLSQFKTDWFQPITQPLEVFR